MGGIIDFFNPRKVAQVYAPPARDYNAEITNILKASPALYANAAEYNPQYADLAANSASRSANTLATGYAGLADTVAQTNNDLLSKFGAGNIASLRAANPEQAGLMTELNRQAMSGLQAGTRLTPDQQYYATNAIKSNYAGRGFAGSLPQGLDEAVALARMGDNVQGQRQGFAQQMAGMENDMYTAPGSNMALSSGGANAASLLGMGAGVYNSQPSSWDQLSAYGSDVFNTNYNAQAAANIATANNKTGIYSSAMSY